ncbi:PPOX class F420-dependent enzyme [Saccharomonospora sp. CUA-673]|uniref:PPOX class F420-dependent oxidoreductase n=1 Tax=Saccharomonospora sp. CUA-673 TaxID=1904969 RepID=UPI000961AA93|nr:PPOX class F420-dependent oxidoreductase [Saccharomonospora sp. CUA-673]OLT48723.1 PPOX class F420-dependent enzyme [Saccharomonospora sp. CUA-673]
MSTPPLPAEAVELLRRPNPAVMATLRSDGAPVSAATWYLWEDDGRVLVNLDEGRARLKHLRRDPRVTLTVLDENWYTHVTLIGRVTEIREDDGLTDIDRLATHYLGAQYPDRVRTRYSAWIEVERWHGWGAHRDSDQATV